MITVVGAGLVGSLWAIFLRQNNYAVQIFEKRSDPRLQKSGAGRSINLVMTSRGLHALEQVGLLQEAKALAVPVYGRMIHALSNELTFQPYGQANECNYSISREMLNQFLIGQAEKAGAKFYFEHELQNLVAEEKRASFKTAHGSYITNYDILFAADGAGSRVRKQLAKIHPALLQETTEWIDANYKELTLPVGLDGNAQLKNDALHIWPRGNKMMMALANRDGSFTVTLYLPKKHFSSLQTAEKIIQFFQTEFFDAVPLMPSAVTEFLQNPEGNLGTVRCSRWVMYDSIALMGDAAHAMVPFFGQGMNCGFEDCTTLNALLHHSKHWPEILSEYERIQKPNAQAISDMALENWVEMRDHVADSRFLLRKKLENEFEKRYPNIYKSRYGLIAYTLVPYALAQQAGKLQSFILNELITNEVTTLEQICWDEADLLIAKHWGQFIKDHNLKL